MNINEEGQDGDIEVFVVGEGNESFKNHNYVEKSNYDFTEEGGFAILKASVILFFVISVAAGLAKGLSSSMSNSSIPFIIIVLILSLLVYLISNACKTAKKPIEEETMRMRIYAQHLKAQNSNKKGNKINQKKFNNLTEYKNSAEFKIDEAAKEKQLSDDIELAVEALCRLGVGKRTANEWVDIGIKSGIQSSDTQSLVKFALRRGL